MGMVTLSSRFTVTFVALVAIPSLFVSVALSRIYLAALYASLAKQTEATAAQVSRSVQREIDSASILAASLANDDELDSLVETYVSSSGVEKLMAYRAIDAKVSSLLLYSNRIGAVELFFADGSRYFASNTPSIWPVANFDGALFSGALAASGKVYLLDTLRGPAGNQGAKNILSAVVCPAKDSRTRLKAILVMARVPYFDELLIKAGPGDSDIVIFGRDGEPLLSSLSQEISVALGRRLSALSSERLPEIRVAGRDWLVTRSSLDSASWEVYLLADKASISSRIAGYSLYVIPALAIIAIVSLAFVKIFLSSIAKPIRGLIESMSKVGKGDYRVRASPAGIVELETLTQGFNSMVVEIGELIEQREAQQREKLASELEALRYQINPHFIANTLNSIRLMARAARADAIADMSGDLMRVLADSYAGASPFIDLEKELESVKSYIAIMKMRFGRRFDVSFSVQNEALSCVTLRMMLQPIVENSILHGFGEPEEADSARPPFRKGHIRIAARVDGYDGPPPGIDDPEIGAVEGRALFLEVIDDGAGMDEAQVSSLLRHGGRGDGLYRIGIENVRKRIELNFGSPFGLAISSEAGKGTAVRYTLPFLARREREGPDA